MTSAPLDEVDWLVGAQGVGGERVWLGLGAWLFDDDPARALALLARC
jgi:hypothetical protein